MAVFPPETLVLMEPFSVGDKAVYPVHGVAEVVAVEDRNIGGRATSVYILKILETGLKIMVPTANAEAVGLRVVICSREVEEVFDILRSREAPRDTQTWNRRHREYMDKIKTGSVFEIAEVLRDLFRLRESKELSFGERRMMEMAKNLLVRELAIARRSPEKETASDVDSALTGPV
jgi:CarD family transcriptional regulator, regulator of rRNA transcription